jgi:hypothetical protein
MTASISEQIAEVEREIAMRRRVCPNWVRTGRMTQADADLHLARMKDVLATLHDLRDGEQEPDPATEYAERFDAKCR